MAGEMGGIQNQGSKTPSPRVIQGKPNEAGAQAGGAKSATSSTDPFAKSDKPEESQGGNKKQNGSSGSWDEEDTSSNTSDLSPQFTADYYQFTLNLIKSHIEFMKEACREIGNLFKKSDKEIQAEQDADKKIQKQRELIKKQMKNILELRDHIKKTIALASNADPETAKRIMAQVRGFIQEAQSALGRLCLDASSLKQAADQNGFTEVSKDMGEALQQADMIQAELVTFDQETTAKIELQSFKDKNRLV